MTSSAIRWIEVKRFRGIRSLAWQPHPLINLILGAADGCKSTVLEAIALLFSVAPNYTPSEFDYHCRDVASGFTIEAVLVVGDVDVLKDEGFPAPPLQGWLNGQLSGLPDENGAEPVLVCRLTGTADQEMLYEVIGAGGEIRAPFSRALRRRIAVARLGVADRGDRDIRLVQGGALDRYLQGQDVRQTVLQAVMRTPLHDELGEGPKTALESISAGFANRNLPNPVRLGLVGTPGVSLAASVGLTVGKSDLEALPLAAWGTGTRRLAALEISTLGVSADAIAVIDEPETGLEPYRQRVFIRDLASHPRQAFVTTHAPAVLSQTSMAKGATWRMSTAAPKPQNSPAEGESDSSPSHKLFVVDGAELKGIAASQPEALFAKLPVVCEGVTEVGFATRMLEHRFGAGFSCRGLYCLDAGGHYKALPIAKSLIGAGYSIAAVVDDEGNKGGSWRQVGQAATLLRWKDGACLEAAILSVLPDGQLLEVHEWADQVTHRSSVHQLAEIRHRLQLQLAEIQSELQIEKGQAAADMFAAVGRESYLAALLAAACPKPERDRKPRGWFKSFDGGYFLADKLLAIAPTPEPVRQVESLLAEIERLTGP